MTIRQEAPQDYPRVYEVIKEAFAAAEHRDGNEQDLVAALRGSDAFLPSLSLVAEVDGQIVGHILFTKAHVGQDEVLALAPLCVIPGYQGQGIGTALILEGHRIARQEGYRYSVVLGSDTYYPRMGYLPAKEFGIEAPDGVPARYLMAIRLQPDARPVRGPIRYAEQFGL